MWQRSLGRCLTFRDKLSFQKAPPKASCAYYVDGVHMEGLNLDNINDALMSYLEKCAEKCAIDRI